jgi:hypothetical protein
LTGSYAPILKDNSYTLSVGAGGIGSTETTPGANGSSSSFYGPNFTTISPTYGLTNSPDGQVGSFNGSTVYSGGGASSFFVAVNDSDGTYVKSTYTDPNTTTQYTILLVTYGTVLIAPSKTINVGYIVVSGGGGGGPSYGGSGGGCAVATLTDTNAPTLIGNTYYTLSVGAGGTPGANGSSSSFYGPGLTSISPTYGLTNSPDGQVGSFNGLTKYSGGGGVSYLFVDVDDTDGEFVESTYTDPITTTQYTILVIKEGTVLITPNKTIKVGYIVVSGGGGGGLSYGGSGGGCAVATLTDTNAPTLIGNTYYTLSVGDRGIGSTGSTPGADGSSSSFSGPGLTTISPTYGLTNSPAGQVGSFNGTTRNSGGGGENMVRAVTVTPVLVSGQIESPVYSSSTYGLYTILLFQSPSINNSYNVSFNCDTPFGYLAVGGGSGGYNINSNLSGGGPAGQVNLSTYEASVLNGVKMNASQSYNISVGTNSTYNNNTKIREPTNSSIGAFVTSAYGEVANGITGATGTANIVSGGIASTVTIASGSGGQYLTSGSVRPDGTDGVNLSSFFSTDLNMSGYVAGGGGGYQTNNYVSGNGGNGGGGGAAYFEEIGNAGTGGAGIVTFGSARNFGLNGGDGRKFNTTSGDGGNGGNGGSRTGSGGGMSIGYVSNSTGGSGVVLIYYLT